MTAKENLPLSATWNQYRSNEAVRFVETQVVIPDESRPVFSPWFGRAALWKQVDGEKEALFTLMEEVQRKLLKKTADNGGPKEKIDVRRCSWSQVVSQVQITAEMWRNRPEKQGKTMIFIDKVGRNRDAFESCLQLLPMGDYGSRSVPDSAAGQYTKVEEDIFKALADIPDIMETARRYVAIYWQKPDHRFEQRIFNLFRASLKTLRHIMQFFADSKYRKLLGAVGKQAGYKSDLTTSLDEMRQCAEAIKDEGCLCQAEETHEARLNSERSEMVANKVLRLLETHPLLQLRPEDIRNALGKEATPYDMANIDRSVSSDAKEGMELLMREQRRRADADKRWLLRLLQYHRASVPKDISTCLQLGYQLDEKAKGRAAAMIGADRFKTFVREAKSSGSLLVNGHEDPAATDGISPLSLVAAELSRLSEEAKAESAPVFVVNYFCAEHQLSPLVIPLSSPPAMMMASFIGQLLSQMTDQRITPDLVFMTEKKWEKVERLQISTLCTVFRKLSRQLPPGGVLWCIIDEISAYETFGLEQDTDLAIGNLSQLVNGAKCGQAVVKLLLTCRSRSLVVSRHFLDVTLDLQEDVDADDSADWAISTMLS
ncbi:hypothetical protein CPLU01_03283 [Colletotrichum plurivorum]|uniref:Uncharacterized protein n=1 Tax=Colletotrichum plurivorum TaxID=2175906 RepID=A0A8H6KTU2_9PEZI|nr:hypothetical protein CPLU01_03283 [Colletotrichum plurivorum]